MTKITENTLRQMVRRIISEAAGAAESVAVTNTTRSKAKVSSVYAKDDKSEKNLLAAGDVGTEIRPGETRSVSFTPTSDATEFVFDFVPFQGTGVTRGYSRNTLIVDYTLGGGTVTYDPANPAADTGDVGEMSAEEIAALAKPGEMHRVIEDPTDPEFAYAVFYEAVPTRAVVVRAPLEDYKGDKVVSSRGQEINSRRYGGSFRKIADALRDEMKRENPGGSGDAAAPAPAPTAPPVK